MKQAAGYIIGLDVGSTTVKAVVRRRGDSAILWQDYRRHETRQAEAVLDFLRRIMDFLDTDSALCSVLITGSGGRTIAPSIGARYVQEVNAVALAVEELHPQAGSAVELGGQDAKILIFQRDPLTGRSKKFTSMNDKCAGGTGAIIDKINAKLRVPADRLSKLGYDGIRLHQVAGKCGVFAETDINGLQKQGVPPDELMASLFESIVQQNLSVLTRGNTLRPEVLLLGGPNTYIRGMVECWRHNIPLLWKERGLQLEEGRSVEDVIYVPDNAQYFAAIGTVVYAERNAVTAPFPGLDGLVDFIANGRSALRRSKVGKGLVDSSEELERFRARYRIPAFTPARLEARTRFSAYLGIDGGSTSTKGVLLDSDLNVAFKSYRLSDGNPIDDTRGIITDLRAQVEAQGAELHILGVGTTGYAKDILRDTMGADVALVETVAHTQAAQRFFENVDVICDVGGQDIKLILLHQNRVVDFKLNTQCSAGNGYFLQSTAEGFGYDVEDYADIAFQARQVPEFGYGCAVFLQSDIVDFQRQGWSGPEIMAGLARVLPRNIWLYVSQISNLEMLGSTFVLQGGTQRNLAAVKAQVDFIEHKFRDLRPRIHVHEHTGEAGAIGTAVEAARLHRSGRETTFIGLDAAAQVRFVSKRDESTRCAFCKNRCLRTFIDVETPSGNGEDDEKRRLIIATCEKGCVEEAEDMRGIARDLARIRKQFPNYAEIAAREVFRPFTETHAQRREQVLNWNGSRRTRASLRLGIPRALNHYAHAPLLTTYLQTLGFRFENLVFSDATNDALFREGSKRGSIDPCFPSKLALAHVHNLLYRKHAQQPLDCIFFPMIDDMPSDLVGTQAAKACPTIVGSVEAAEAAYTKEGDMFTRLGVRYIHPFVNLANPALASRQLFAEMHTHFGVERSEHEEALAAGYDALQRFHGELRSRAAQTLRELEQEQRLGIVLLARPYHNDEGINHGILAEFQKLGYPVFTQDSLPTDEASLARVFGADLREGRIGNPMEIGDVWKNSYSENTNRKVWAAKYVARHPNLVALELSSFKCGHDGPIYAIVQEVVECSGTPYFSFKDIDENRPTGSIRIRVETIGYFLKRYRETLATRAMKEDAVSAKLREYEARLLKALHAQQQQPHFAGTDSGNTP
ncbi:MAG: BadF/BadG/BcrA/BcrD ATPase family protein, partial [Bacteroidota bacterium]|nr:BadF/BadG/BcrA/BcrD ATPase family protein [Bacteroidota bacterium]